MAADRSPLWRDALHLSALSSIAVAQPLFDILRQNPTFFVAHKTTSTGIVAFAALTVIVPAAVLVGVRWPAGLASSALCRRVQAGLVGFVVAAIVVPPVSRAASPPTLVEAVMFVAVALATGVAYDRFAVVGRFLTALAPAPALILGLFLLTGPIRGLVFPSEVDAAEASAKKDTPVVMLILDEFSLASILDPTGEIDGERFPHLGAVAGDGTWYRNATTNSTGTGVSVPIINTGVFPADGVMPPPPVASEYPDNLFTLLHPSMDVHAEEFVTHLCPPWVCRAAGDRFGGAKDLFSDAAIVYLHVVLPTGVTAQDYFPQINADWTGFVGDARAVDELASEAPRLVRPVLRAVLKPFASPPAPSEAARMLSFIDRIADHPPSTFHYSHLRLPHVPLELVPSLHRYDGRGVPGRELHSTPDRDAGERDFTYWSDDSDLVDQALQRYLLQAKAADELIGRLSDTLRERGLWDDALVVITSDHGVTYQPGERRRRISEKTEADILPVPLIIKYPHQTKGLVDDRNAQLVDIAPTIADVLDVDLPWRADGHPLGGRDPGVERKRLWRLEGAQLFPPVIDGVNVTARRIRDVFGRARSSDDVYAMGPYADLIGTKVAATKSASDVRAVVQNAGAFRDVDPKSGFIPARLTAALRGRPRERWIVASLNGRVAGAGVAYRSPGGAWRASIMLSDRLFRDGRNRVDLYSVTRDGELERMTRPRAGR